MPKQLLISSSSTPCPTFKFLARGRPYLGRGGHIPEPGRPTLYFFGATPWADTTLTRMQINLCVILQPYHECIHTHEYPENNLGS